MSKQDSCYFPTYTYENSRRKRTKHSNPQGRHNKYHGTTVGRAQALLCGWHNGNTLAPRMEVLDHGQIRWNHRHGWTYTCVLDPDRTLHLWWCNFLQSIPNIPKRCNPQLVHLSCPTLCRLFRHLIIQFGEKFATSKPHDLTSLALISIRQEEGESLRSFVERFDKACPHIDNLSLEVALYQMINALRSGPFADSLCKRPTTSMA